MTYKIVYFLGAGASYGAGSMARGQGGAPIPIPTQLTFWSTFLRFCHSSANRRTIESFLFRYFLGYNKVPSRLALSERRALLTNIDVEEVFTFLSERVRAPSTSPQLRTYALSIWDALVSEIGHVFRRFKPNISTRRVYRSFLASHCRASDSVVSFNYDTIFEKSLYRADRPSYFGVEKSDEFQILKPHGSVNWSLEKTGKIEVDDLSDRSVIVAPTHLKFVMSSYSNAAGTDGYLDQSVEIGLIWQEMEKLMRRAEALVFIGYSFPVADLYFSSVLRSVLADRKTRPSIVVVNPDAVDIAARLQKRFSLPKVLKYFDLAQFIQSPRNAVFLS